MLEENKRNEQALEEERQLRTSIESDNETLRQTVECMQQNLDQDQ